MVASPEKFAEAIKSDNVQVLDVRTADEYKSGHIKKALQANWLNKIEFNDRTTHLDKNKPVNNPAITHAAIFFGFEISFDILIYLKMNELFISRQI